MSIATLDHDEIDVVTNAVRSRLAVSLDRARNCLDHGALADIGDHLDRAARLVDVLLALTVAGTGPSTQDALSAPRREQEAAGSLDDLLLSERGGASEARARSAARRAQLLAVRR